MRTRFLLVLALLIAGSAAATRGTPDPVTSLDSLGELWSDTLRDIDQIGMQATRVSDAEEMKIGEQLAQSQIEDTAANRAASDYVTGVGQMLEPHLRRHGVRYRFHVVDSDAINAFALPGGQIFVTAGMLNFVASEAELAAILGHEMSHVDLRHCIEHYQYEASLRRAGMPEAGQIVEFAHSLATFSFTKYEEADADAQGERLAIEAGYDPRAAEQVMLRLEVHMREAPRTAARTPTGEVAKSIGEALEDFFRSHPLTAERVQSMHAMVERERPELAGKQFYVGVRNLRDRVARSKHEFPDEFKRFQ
jgi:predicted Zn-dependent protease